METTHHGEDASPDNPPRQQKSGNTDEQTIALTKARLAIDEVDARIVGLLKNEWVHEVGRIKKEKNSPIFVPERETALLNKLNRLNAGVLPEASLQAIYREIISCSFFLEGGLTIANCAPKEPGATRRPSSSSEKAANSFRARASRTCLTWWTGGRPSTA